MEDGKWKMENGRWKMENGKWKMESALPFALCPLQRIEIEILQD